MPFLGERVGMTEATRLHFDSNLSRPGLRNLSLDHLKRSTRATHLDDAHLGHTCSPGTADFLRLLTRPSYHHRPRCQRLLRTSSRRTPGRARHSPLPPVYRPDPTASYVRLAPPSTRIVWP